MTGKVVTAIKYKSTVNQKKPKDLVVGEMAKNMIADKDSINLRDSKVEEFYNAVVEFYKAGLDYLLIKMLYNDELLDKAYYNCTQCRPNGNFFKSHHFQN